MVNPPDQVAEVTAEGKADAHELLHPAAEFGFRPSNDFAPWQSRAKVVCRVVCAVSPKPDTEHAAAHDKSGRHSPHSSSRGLVHPDGNASKLSAAPRAPQKIWRLTEIAEMPELPSIVATQTSSSATCHDHLSLPESGGILARANLASSRRDRFCFPLPACCLLPSAFCYGAPAGIRTPNQQIMSLLL
jgi:hypothetical protein